MLIGGPCITARFPARATKEAPTAALVTFTAAAARAKPLEEALARPRIKAADLHWRLPVGRLHCPSVAVLQARQTTPGCLEGSRRRQQASQAAEKNGPLKLFFAGTVPRNRLPDQQGRRTTAEFVFVHAVFLSAAEPVRLREGENRYLTERARVACLVSWLDSRRSRDS
ncbi:hypothetical protein MTO96_022266 [Rhipicephalus appendiculatus]